MNPIPYFSGKLQDPDCEEHLTRIQNLMARRSQFGFYRVWGFSVSGLAKAWDLMVQSLGRICAALW